jgi:hypothetical protein
MTNSRFRPVDRATGSGAQKRAIIVLLALAILATLGSSRVDRPARPPLPNVSFSQLDIQFDGDKHKHSQWGAAELEFIGSPGILYFNLTVRSGNSSSPVWRIQNLPVLSREGAGVEQKATFYFDLANTPGKNVQGLDYAFALTASPLSDMPLASAPANVANRRYEIDTGFGGRPISFAPPAEMLVGGAAEGGPCSHEGFPNPAVDEDECVPAAASNSLNWMNELYGLGIPTDLITLDAMKGATGWDKSIPGCDDNWPEKKAKYLVDHDIPVSSDTVDRFRIDKIYEAICNGCDVELGIGNHFVAVTGIQKLEDGNFSLDLTHDSDQGKKDGTVTETIKYDDTEGRFHGSPWLENKAPELIVVECPTIMTPTPTPTATPSPTPTPTPTSGSPTPSVTQSSVPTSTLTPTSMTPTPVSPTPTPGS